MKRRYMHAGFAVVAAVFAGIAGTQLLSLHRADKIQRAIASIDIAGAKPTIAEAQLAWATALSEAGALEKSEAAFNELIRRYKNHSIGDAAQFNLANGYLRQGMLPDLEPGQTLPMIELAKQRYRDLLRTHPDDWNARFNLELALRLAPETTDARLVDDKGKPVKSVNVVVPDFKIRDLP